MFAAFCRISHAVSSPFDTDLDLSDHLGLPLASRKEDDQKEHE
jgi:hypothetical protein